VPQAVPIDPQKLLEAARDFANQTGGRGRPRPVWLRRAVSSAYYALFHDLTRQAAVHLLPHDSSQHQLRVARTFRHQNMKEVCEQVAGRHGKPNRHMKPLVQSLAGTQVARVADSFCDLQEARHRADYDHLALFSREVALAHVEVAEKAIQTLAAACDRERDALFALIAVSTRLF
jgi:uncharacterized protein (UPF0332 family)